MRILGQMVVRNEADRYLDCSLRWHMAILDGVHVYDDRSDDNTAALAYSHRVQLTERPDGVPSFLEHEGHFREAAWRAFEFAMAPTEDDWVLAFDADEFLTSPHDEIASLDTACREANHYGWLARKIAIPEVFAVTVTDDGDLIEPQVRMDGYWGSIIGTRLFRYQRGGHFAERPMGSGSEPTYVAEAGQWGPPADNLFLVHYGYAFPEDQRLKHERYSRLMQNGHADRHIASIVEPPSLVRWDGPAIDVWRGQRAVK